MFRFFFSFQGRISRAQSFFAYWVIWGVLCVGCLLALRIKASGFEGTAAIIAATISLAFFASHFALNAKRARDRRLRGQTSPNLVAIGLAVFMVVLAVALVISLIRFAHP